MADSSKDIQLRELKDMVAELKNLIKTLQETVDAANEREKSLTQERDNLKEELRLLRQKLFGTSSEKRPAPPKEQNLFNEAEKEQYPAAAEAEEIAAQLAEVKLTIGAKTSSTGKIFGSVNSIMISESLKEKGFDIDRKKIVLKDVKEVGTYTALIKLHREVKVDVEFEVVSE